MKWTDTIEIAIALIDQHPDIDPVSVRFTDLQRWVLELPQFDDAPELFLRGHQQDNQRARAAIDFSGLAKGGHLRALG